MKLVREKLFNTFLAILLLISLLIPNVAFAYDIKGDVDNPTLTIHKFEQEPDEVEGEEGTGSQEQGVTGDPLEGVEFTLTQTHAYNPNTDEWTEVSGTSITRVTNADGQIIIANIELGRYKVQETNGPPHVNLNTEEYFVDIPMTSADGATLNYDVHIYPKNEIIRGAVELHKLDGEQVGKVGLAGAVFELYTSDDELVEAGLTTDSEGFIRVNGLAYGDYYFKEISAPDDYVLFGDKKHFSITKSGTVMLDGTKTGKVENIEITNYKAPAIEKTVEGSTEIHETNRETEFTYNLKIALPEDIAKYEEFVITDILDDRLNYTGTWYIDEVKESYFNFKQDGQTLTWTVNNFDALDGIDFVTVNFTAEIKAGVEVEPIENDAKIDFTNESGSNGKKTPEPAIVIPTEGSLKIIKQDGDLKDLLEGAEFELRDLAGNVVESGTTDIQGEISWTRLDYGKYQIVETKAPEGYRILKKPIDITIDKENSDISLNVDNYKSGWELPTTGGIGSIVFTITGLILMGAALILYVRRRKSVTD